MEEALVYLEIRREERSFYQPKCSQCSSTPGPPGRIQSAVAFRMTVMRGLGPHPMTRTRSFGCADAISWRMRETTSGRLVVICIPERRQTRCAPQVPSQSEEEFWLDRSS
jgi:hypothetical protein